jgi:hypothetical protein
MTLTSAADRSPFDEATLSVFRLETYQTYVAEGERTRVQAFLTGQPLPERTVLTSPMMARMARTTMAGVVWTRARLITWPLTDYTRFALVGYQESAAVGLRTFLAYVDTHPELAALDREFWLFDAGTPRAVAMLMDYDSNGRLLGSRITRDSAELDRCDRDRELALAHAIPLNHFLAEKAALIRA